MKKRLFLAINLPSKIKNNLEKFNQQFGSDNFRLTTREDFHITVLFLGYVEEKNISEICKIVAKIATSIKSFSLEFKSVTLAPPNAVKTMVWVTFDKSKAYSELVETTNLKLRLFINQEIRSERIPHITLLRSSEKISSLKISPLKSFTLPAIELGLFESKPAKEGSHYFKIKTFKLKKTN